MLGAIAPEVARAIADVDGLGDRLVEEVVRVASIPAPTFSEGARGAYVRDAFHSAGLAEVGTDEVGNVWGVIPGRDRSNVLLVAAHMDTVFPHDVPVEPVRSGQRLRGP